MRHLFKLSIAVIALATLSLTAKADTRFSAYLTGGQNGTASTATGYAKLTLNAAETTVSYTLTYSGLGSAENATHVHGDASPGVDAGILFTLNSTGATSGTVSGSFSVTTAQVTSLKSGLWYINVHTVNFGNGEIRGQINPAINISEFRFRGTADADEYIELYNDSDVSVTVDDLAPDGAVDGWTLVGLNPSSGAATSRFLIQSGTVIPARGHFLAVSSAYSLASNASGDTIRSASTGNVISSYTGLVDAGAIALFRTNNTTHLPATGALSPTLGGAYRLDAVGFTSSSTHSLFFEGTALTNAPTGNDQFAYFRSLTSGRAKDTDNNSADFTLVSTDGNVVTTATVDVPLGAPGPENTASPLRRNAELTTTVPVFGGGSTRERYSDCANLPTRLTAAGITCTTSVSELGFLSLRRRIVNNTGASVTRLRFRIVDITTLNNTAGITGAADVRALTSPGDSTSAPYGGLQPTTLETPPTQSLGGGLNSTVSAGVITLTNSLTNGTGIDLEFLLGVRTGGTYRFLVNIEALP